MSQILPEFIYDFFDCGLRSWSFTFVNYWYSLLSSTQTAGDTSIMKPFSCDMRRALAETKIEDGGSFNIESWLQVFRCIKAWGIWVCRLISEVSSVGEFKVLERYSTMKNRQRLEKTNFMDPDLYLKLISFLIKRLLYSFISYKWFKLFHMKDLQTTSSKSLTWSEGEKPAVIPSSLLNPTAS